MSEENAAEKIMILRETYELGSKDFQIYVCWFPAIVKKFGDQLEDIANQIARECIEIGSFVLWHHVFDYEDEKIIIATSYNEAKNIIGAHADLVAFQDVLGEVDLLGNGEPQTIVMPVPASRVPSVH